MKYRIFTIPVINPEAATSRLDQFLGATPIAQVEKHLVADGQNSFWTFCISYYDNSDEAAAVRARKVDFREVLSEPDFAVFAKLRTLRKDLAEKEGVPAYAIFSNDQLAAMVTQKVTTAAALTALNGVGESRLQKYGAQFLAILRREFSSEAQRPSNGHETVSS